ncbi:MAG: PHB depolymerase family esterase [Planctomycetota bacterium]|jgi:predicted esterase
MSRRTIFVLFLCIFTLAVPLQARQDGKKQSSKSGLSYILSKAKDTEGDAPLLLCLHGKGDTPENFSHVLSVFGGEDFTKFTAVVPGGPGRQWQYSNCQKIMDLLDEIISKHKIDTNRVHVMGFSQGAYITLTLGARRPKRFATMAGFSGGWVGGTEPAEGIKDVKVMLVHGKADRVVPPSGSRKAKKVLEAAGCKVIHKEIDGWGHKLRKEDIQAWLKFALENSKGKAKKPAKSKKKKAFKLTVTTGARVITAFRKRITVTENGEQSHATLSNGDTDELRALVDAILDLEAKPDAPEDGESIRVEVSFPPKKKKHVLHVPAESAPQEVRDLLAWLEKKSAE